MLGPGDFALELKYAHRLTDQLIVDKCWRMSEIKHVINASVLLLPLVTVTSSDGSLVYVARGAAWQAILA